MSRFILCSIVLVLVVGCETNNAGTESGNPPTVNLPKLGEPTSGAEVAGCESDDECMERMEAEPEILKSWAETHDDWITYESSYCGRAEIDSEEVYHLGGEKGEPSCLCVDDTYTSGDLLTPTIQSDCLVRGRFNLCVFYKDEFSGCDLTKATESCEPICQEIESRNQQDAKWDADVSLRLARCIREDQTDPVGTCHYLLEDDADCYAIGMLLVKVLVPLDCTMTDDELVNELQENLCVLPVNLSGDWPKNTGLPVIRDDEADAGADVGQSASW